MTELPQFVEVFVWSNNLQNVQQSVGERERERERERVGEGGGGEGGRDVILLKITAHSESHESDCYPNTHAQEKYCSCL